MSFRYNKQYIDRNLLFKYNSHRIPGPCNIFCHASQKNIYFSTSGKAIACCYNKEYSFGVFNNNNLQEIINSNNRKMLTESLKNNNLSKGCDFCKKAIMSENYNAIGAHQYDMIPLNGKYPVMMEFELDNVCNLACIMCSPLYSSKLGGKQNKQLDNKSVYNKNFVHELKPYIPYLYKTKFFGGEPFLIDIYYDIWTEIIDINPKCEIIVQTNATVLNEKIKKMLEKGNFRISISIDSLDKNNYEYIRKGASFENVMNNIGYFIKYSKTKKRPLFFSVCPMQQNWQDIPAIIEYCNKNNIYINFNTVTTPYECAIINMHPDDILKIKQYYESVKIKTGNFIRRQNKKHFDGLTNQIKAWYRYSCQIENSKKKYSLETIKQILINKAGDVSDKEAFEIFEKVFYSFPAEIELSDFHFNRINNLKPHSVKKVFAAKDEEIIKRKLNNIFALKNIN